MPGSPPTPPARQPSWADGEHAIASGVGKASPQELVLGEGTVLAGKYRLARPAGFGGMAQLWVATNASTGAEVCVKILVPESNDDESVKRFRREAHAAARLSHRAIVRVFDLVELDANGATARQGAGTTKALAIVMELLAGETLGDLLMKRGKLPLDEALDLFIPVLSALAHAHRAGVVHRDIKPDNVFLAKDPDGHVTPKVLDFGISKLQGDKSQLTNDGVMLGTPSFMSPEQARGASKVDARSDVFSAAIVFLMMLSGQNPFEEESFHAVMSAILTRAVPRVPDVPDAIWEVVERALAKEPVARFADATELGIALRRAAGRQVVTESTPWLRAPTDSAVSVPPVSPGTTGEQEAHDPEGDEVEAVAGLPEKRGLPIVAVAGGVAAIVAVVVVLVTRSLVDGGSHAGPAVVAPSVAAATLPPATPAAIEPAAPAPSASASAAPSSTAAAAPTVVAPPAAQAPRPRPSKPAAPAPAPKGGEPSIVRDPGF